MRKALEMPGHRNILLHGEHALSLYLLKVDID